MIAHHYKSFLAALVLLLVTGCTLLQTSPEKQILTGANSLAASANLTTIRLQQQKITVTQAKDYRAIMATASAVLDNNNAELLACRARTASTQNSVPDPCRSNVIADINLATAILGQIEATLKAKGE